MMKSKRDFRGTIFLHWPSLWKSKISKVIKGNFWIFKIFCRQKLGAWSLHIQLKFHLSSPIQWAARAIFQKKNLKKKFGAKFQKCPNSAPGAPRVQLLYHKVSLLGTTPYHPIWSDSAILAFRDLVYFAPKSTLKLWKSYLVFLLLFYFSGKFTVILILFGFCDLLTQ